MVERTWQKDAEAAFKLDAVLTNLIRDFHSFSFIYQSPQLRRRMKCNCFLTEGADFTKTGRTTNVLHDSSQTWQMYANVLFQITVSLIPHFPRQSTDQNDQALGNPVSHADATDRLELPSKATDCIEHFPSKNGCTACSKSKA